MKSLETQFVEIKEVWKNAGKERECEAIIKGSFGKSLEEKLDKLTTGARSFWSESDRSNGGTKNELVEAYKNSLGFTQAEAEVAAGIRHTTRNQDPIVTMLTETNRAANPWPTTR